MKIPTNHVHLAQEVLRQRLAGHPGVHGVKLRVTVRELDATRRQKLPPSELQLVIMHVANIRHIVAYQVVEVTLILQGLFRGLRTGNQLDPAHVFLQGF